MLTENNILKYKIRLTKKNAYNNNKLHSIYNIKKV